MKKECLIIILTLIILNVSPVFSADLKEECNLVLSDSENSFSLISGNSENLPPLIIKKDFCPVEKCQSDEDCIKCLDENQGTEGSCCNIEKGCCVKNSGSSEGRCIYDACDCKEFKEGLEKGSLSPENCRTEKAIIMLNDKQGINSDEEYELAIEDNEKDSLNSLSFTGMVTYEPNYDYMQKTGNTYVFRIKEPKRMKFYFNLNNKWDFEPAYRIKTEGDLVSLDILKGNTLIFPDTGTLPSKSSGEKVKINVLIKAENIVNEIRGKINIFYDKGPVLNLERFAQDRQRAILEGRESYYVKKIRENKPLTESDLDKLDEIRKELAKLPKIVPENFQEVRTLDIIIKKTDEDLCIVHEVIKMPDENEVSDKIDIFGDDKEDKNIEIIPEYDKNIADLKIKTKLKIEKEKQEKLDFKITFKGKEKKEEKKKSIMDSVGDFLNKKTKEKKEEAKQEECKTEDKTKEDEKEPYKIILDIKDRKTGKIYDCVIILVKESKCCYKENSEEYKRCEDIYGKDFQSCPLKIEKPQDGLNCCAKGREVIENGKKVIYGGCNTVKINEVRTESLCCNPNEKQGVFNTIIGNVPTCNPTRCPEGKRLCESAGNQVDICCPLYDNDDRNVCLNFQKLGVVTPICGKEKCDETEFQCPADSNPFAVNDEKYKGKSGVLCCEKAYEDCSITPFNAVPMYPMPICTAKKDVKRPGYFRCEGMGFFKWSARWCKDNAEKCSNHPTSGVPICVPVKK